MVEALVGLVEKQYAGAAQEGEREIELLPCAAGEVPRLCAVGGRERELVEQPVALADRVPARHAERWCEQRQVLIGRQQVEEPRLLRAVADAAADVHGPAVRVGQPGADPQQRALAGAVLADDRDRLPEMDVERRVVQDEPASVGLPDAACVQLRALGAIGLCVESCGRRGRGHCAGRLGMIRRLPRWLWRSAGALRHRTLLVVRRRRAGGSRQLGCGTMREYGRGDSQPSG